MEPQCAPTCVPELRCSMIPGSRLPLASCPRRLTWPLSRSRLSLTPCFQCLRRPGSGTGDRFQLKLNDDGAYRKTARGMRGDCLLKASVRVFGLLCLTLLGVRRRGLRVCQACPADDQREGDTHKRREPE